MDYEKKYKEALERAKKFYNELAACRTKQKVAAIFPELRESEDEGIRKSLVQTLQLAKRNDGKIVISNTLADKYIAWLEKQKEQEPVERSREGNYIIGFVYALLNQIEWKDNWAMSKDECLRRLNNYRPQNPAEWSEDYREEDIQTRFAFYTYKDEDGVLYLSNVFVEEKSRNHGFGTKILIAAEKVAETIGATTISLKVKQDSPANAWYRKNGYGYVAFEDGYDWLEKNLEYMKPNKQEWSEEDKEKIVTISEIIEHCTTIPYSGGTLTLNKEYKKELLCFIRSLRPSWKPSEDELTKKHLEGYIKGRNDALREMSDFMESHFNTQSGTSIKSGGNE